MQDEELDTSHIELDDSLMLDDDDISEDEDDDHEVMVFKICPFSFPFVDLVLICIYGV